MNNSITITQIRRIKINIHISWLLVFAILAYVLSTNFYPLRYEFDNVINWILGISSAILLFVSVFLHELAHSIIAQKKNIEVKSITLFFFGGLANLETDPEEPSIEFKISIAGPIASLCLGLFFHVLYLVNLGVYVTPVFDYMSKINIILAVFNLIPAFPLDGGRVFRSILWKYYNNFEKATKIASYSGKIFGGILIALGILLFPAGLWFIFIGAFLMFLAESGYKQALVKSALDNMNIKKLVSERPLINPDWSLYDFIQWCTNNDVLEGVIKENDEYYIVDLNSLQSSKKNENELIINSIMFKTRTINIEKEEPYKLFRNMQNNGENILPVVEDNNYIGVITMDTILRFVKIINIINSYKKKQNINK